MRRRSHVGSLVLATLVAPVLGSLTHRSVHADALSPEWISPSRYRVLLAVDPVRGGRSLSPATVELDLRALLDAHGIDGASDPATLEVVAHVHSGAPFVFDTTRRGYERYLVPHRLDADHGAPQSRLSFVLPDERSTVVAIYFDTATPTRAASSPGPAVGAFAPRYVGPVGDGDFLRERFGRREIGATHFDTFVDLDEDGDLDLVRGGVEPYLHVHENVGASRLVARGRLTSGGVPLHLPHNEHNHRSWVLPHFHDLDGDGDRDLLASFMDGPHAGRFVLFERTTAHDGAMTFTERGPLTTAAGTPLAGGEQAGGWFPSVAFLADAGAGGEGTLDLVVGSNNHAYFYASLGRDAQGRWRWAEAVPLVAGDAEIELFNPCFAAADIDGDGDADLFGAPQSGKILYYENLGVPAAAARRVPVFAAGVTIAYDELYVQRSTHPRVTIADFTGDGLLDLVIDRAWELADLRRVAAEARGESFRDFGVLLANAGTSTAPRWERRGARDGAPFTEEFQPCDALRQSVVRATDWDRDGRLDILAGDCDGFIWYYRNEGSVRTPVFAPARRLRAGGAVLSLAERAGHARPDVCDWNGDGRSDLVVADGAGGVTLFRGTGEGDAGGEPVLSAGERLRARDAAGTPAPIQLGTRAHVLVCDWNSDGRSDLVVSDQDNPGFRVHLGESAGEGAAPTLSAARPLPLTRFVRPNLGSFVDWDGDGDRDLIACEFEHSIRLYRNEGDGRPDAEPVLSAPDGVELVRPSTIMMISGADAVDFNGDGDLDLLTGQGHGGSGIRFYERDFIEDSLAGTHPRVTAGSVEVHATPAGSFLDVVRRYADAMLTHGRDVWGDVESGLLLSALDRRALRPLEVRPSPPGGIRRGDRAGLPWRRLTGANPHNDENLLRALYVLSELTADERYSRAADHEIEWFFAHAQSPVTGLLPWGEHLAWDALLDRPISSGTELTHEFARPWVLWERTFALAPDAATRFAYGLWEHQIADQATGAFDRHAPYDRHGPNDGKDFPRHGGFYVHTWAYAFAATRDETFLRAIEAVVARFERKRSAGGTEQSTMGPLDVATAATLVPEPLARRLRDFAATEDRLVIADLRAQYGNDTGGFELDATWEAGYSVGVTAGIALFAAARLEQGPEEDARPAYREIIVAVADAYLDALPAEDVDVWPMTLGHVISAELAAFRLTRDRLYLGEACRFAAIAVDLFFQDCALPRASLRTDHYETITGADSLALALLELHVARSGVPVAVPQNSIDR